LARLCSGEDYILAMLAAVKGKGNGNLGYLGVKSF